MGELLVQHYNMKAFIAIIATLVAYASAEAEAEADPAVLYANAYSPYGHYGYGYGLGAYGYGAGYYGLGHYGAYAGYYGYPYSTYAAGGKSAPCVNSLNVPVPCAGRKRRDADAAYYYGGYYGLGYGYPYGYGYGLAYNTGVAAHPGAATSSTFRSPQGLSGYYWGK